MAALADQLKPLWRVGTDLYSGSLQRQALAQTAQKTKENALKNMAAVVGADLVMRNYPRGGRSKPRKAGFGYEVHGTESPTLNFRPGGFWRSLIRGPCRRSLRRRRRWSAKQWRRMRWRRRPWRGKLR